MSSDSRLAAAARSDTASATPPPPPPPPVDPAADSTMQGMNQVDGTNGHVNGVKDDDSFKLKFCTVCASNNNRSMEGHLRLADAGYPVISFGTGTLVRLPGPSITQPNVYDFNTSSYDDMYKELEDKDQRLYSSNGMLNILDRNRKVKFGPERWQDWQVGVSRMQHEKEMGAHGVESGVVDIVITCEERCWDSVVDDLSNRGSPLNRPVHVFNMDIRDSAEEAVVGGRAIVDLADQLNAAAIEERDGRGTHGWEQGQGPGRASFDERVPDILGEWQERWPQFPAVWTLAWF